MQFNSLNFLLFFPVVTVLYFVIPGKIQNFWLLFVSYFFYMCWNPKYILLLLSSTVATYAGGLVLEKVKQMEAAEWKRERLKKLAVAGSVLLNISLLFYFKYINFALDLMQRLLSRGRIHLEVPVFDIVLPVGISFYIFQALGYTVDVYRDEIYAKKDFFRYALFVSFFPQLVAGPIERSKNLLKQFTEPKRFDYDRARSGLLMMLWGFFLKLVVADRCAVLVNTVYEYPLSYYGFQLVTANILFALQIYCDFMGYFTIAKGAARVLGFELMDNFHLPYFAESIKDES